MAFCVKQKGERVMTLTAVMISYYLKVYSNGQDCGE